mgnify:CR=1 FL=1
MNLNELKPVAGARHAKKRVGRGIGSGEATFRACFQSRCSAGLSP